MNGSREATIEARLDGLRRYLRAVFLADGISRAVWTATAILAGAFLVDWIFRLPSELRLVILIAGAAALLRIVWRRIIGPAIVPLSLDDAAIAVEREYPELDDKLISAVQLKREAARPEALISRELVEALRVEASSASEPLNFRHVIEVKQVTQWAGAALISVLAMAVWAGVSPGAASTAFGRIFNPYGPAKWPYRTDLRLGQTEDEVLVPRGEGLTLSATACKTGYFGGTPKKAELRYRHAPGEDWLTESMKRSTSEKGGFHVDFRAVSNSFEYCVQAGDHRSETRSVRVVDRPSVNSFAVSCAYPEYTGLGKKVVAEGHGSFQAVVGTTALIEARTNKLLRSATMEVGEERIPLKVSSDGHAFGHEIPIKEDMTYEIRLVGSDGFENAERYRYTVVALEDRAPEVKVPTPGEDLEVAPNALVPIEARITDDFGVKSARIDYTRASDQAKPNDLAFAEVNLGTTEAVGTLKWDLSEMNLTPGMVVSYQAVAADGCTPTGEGRSTQYHLRILSPEEIAARLERAKLALRAEVARIKALQEQTGELVDEVREAIADSDRFSLVERQKSIRAESSQSSLARRSGDAAKMAKRIARDLENNRMLSKTEQERLAGVESVLSGLQRKDMPEASKSIGKARGSKTPGGRRDGFKGASAKQEKIVDKLDKLLDEMQRWQKTAELLRLARKLLEDQRDIRKASLATARSEKFRPPVDRDSLDAPSRRALNALGSRQGAASEKMDSLLRRMLDVQPTLAKSDPFAHKNVTESIQVARAIRDSDPPDISGRMKTASGNVRTLRWGLALSDQDVAIDGLEQIVEILARRQETDWDKIAKELGKAGEKLDKLIKDQTGLRGKTKGHESSSGAAKSLADASKKLDGIIKKQNDINKSLAGAKSGAETKAQSSPQGDLSKQTGALSKQVESASKSLPSQGKSAQKSLAGAQGSQSKGSQSASKGQSGKPGAQKSGQQASKQLAQAKKELDKLQKEAKAAAKKPGANELANKQDNLRSMSDRLKRQLERLAEKSGLKKAQSSSSKMGGASKSMKQASGSMSSGKSSSGSDQASSEQYEALQKMQQARKDLKEAEEEAKKRAQEKKIFEITQAIKEMHAEQKEIGIEIKSAEKTRLEQPEPEGEGKDEPKEKVHSRKAAMELIALTRRQAELEETAAGVVKKLKDEAPVFHFVLDETKTDMHDVAEKIGGLDTGELTQEVAQDVEDRLLELLTALKKEKDRRKKEKKKGGGGGGGGGGGKKKPLVPPLAELKMILTLQNSVNRRTKSTHKKVTEQPKGADISKPLKQRVERLAGRQGDIGKITGELIDSLTPGKGKPQAPAAPGKKFKTDKDGKIVPIVEEKTGIDIEKKEVE